MGGGGGGLAPERLGLTEDIDGRRKTLQGKRQSEDRALTLTRNLQISLSVFSCVGPAVCRDPRVILQVLVRKPPSRTRRFPEWRKPPSPINPASLDFLTCTQRSSQVQVLRTIYDREQTAQCASTQSVCPSKLVEHSSLVLCGHVQSSTVRAEEPVWTVASLAGDDGKNCSAERGDGRVRRSRNLIHICSVLHPQFRRAVIAAAQLTESNWIQKRDVPRRTHAVDELRMHPARREGGGRRAAGGRATGGGLTPAQSRRRSILGDFTCRAQSTLRCRADLSSHEGSISGDGTKSESGISVQHRFEPTHELVERRVTKTIFGIIQTHQH